MEKQKYKRGTRVKMLVGHRIYRIKDGVSTTIDIAPEEVGKFALIQYSCGERYNNGDLNSYSVIFEEDGHSSAWKSLEFMEYVDEGGEHLIMEAAAKRKGLVKRNRSFKYIASHIEDWALGSDSITFLFKKIGYESAFERNGEYYSLYQEWLKWSWIFIWIKNSESLEEAKFPFTDAGNGMYDVELVYNGFQKALSK